MYYAVMSLETEGNVQLMNYQQPIEFNWHDGQVGAIPVFHYRTDAEEVAGDQYDIVEIAESNKEE